MILGSSLSGAELDRYARQIILKEVGGTGQVRLKAARVLVVGGGGIGSPVVQYLTAAGVGRLRLIDDDAVSRSNLQRQTLYAAADIGRPKVVVAAEAARRINPLVEIEPVAARIDADNAAALVAGCDVVIDGCDNFPTRLLVADAALKARVPLVSAAVGQFDGQLGVFRGWEPTLPCYRCFVGGDPDREGVSCAEDGVLGPVTGVLGSLAALEAIRAVVPFGDDPAGKVMLIDTLAFRFRTLRLPKDAGCGGCGMANPG